MLTLERYVGRPVEIIYLDLQGKISQRQVRPLQIEREKLIAYCLYRKKLRTFLVSGILAAQPIASPRAL
jgi:predicted DNA-binding transcriptional regulator YafY